MPDEGFDQEFEQLRERYRGKFEHELERLAAELSETESAGFDRPRLEAIRGLAHRLMGTSGSYGLEASSAALERMEARLDHLLAGAEADPGAVWSEIESDLAAARAAAGR